jgi:hypothetical protein
LTEIAIPSNKVDFTIQVTMGAEPIDLSIAQGLVEAEFPQELPFNATTKATPAAWEDEIRTIIIGIIDDAEISVLVAYDDDDDFDVTLTEIAIPSNKAEFTIQVTMADGELLAADIIGTKTDLTDATRPEARAVVSSAARPTFPVSGTGFTASGDWYGVGANFGTTGSVDFVITITAGDGYVFGAFDAEAFESDFDDAADSAITNRVSDKVVTITLTYQLLPTIIKFTDIPALTGDTSTPVVGAAIGTAWAPNIEPVAGKYGVGHARWTDDGGVELTGNFGVTPGEDVFFEIVLNAEDTYIFASTEIDDTSFTIGGSYTDFPSATGISVVLSNEDKTVTIRIKYELEEALVRLTYITSKITNFVGSPYEGAPVSSVEPPDDPIIDLYTAYTIIKSEWTDGFDTVESVKYFTDTEAVYTIILQAYGVRVFDFGSGSETIQADSFDAIFSPHAESTLAAVTDAGKTLTITITFEIKEPTSLNISDISGASEAGLPPYRGVEIGTTAPGINDGAYYEVVQEGWITGVTSPTGNFIPYGDAQYKIVLEAAHTHTFLDGDITVAEIEGLYSLAATHTTSIIVLNTGRTLEITLTYALQHNVIDFGYIATPTPNMPAMPYKGAATTTVTPPSIAPATGLYTVQAGWTATGVSGGSFTAADYAIYRITLNATTDTHRFNAAIATANFVSAFTGSSNVVVTNNSPYTQIHIDITYTLQTRVITAIGARADISARPVEGVSIPSGLPTTPPSVAPGIGYTMGTPVWGGGVSSGSFTTGTATYTITLNALGTHTFQGTVLTGLFTFGGDGTDFPLAKDVNVINNNTSLVVEIEYDIIPDINFEDITNEDYTDIEGFISGSDLHALNRTEVADILEIFNEGLLPLDWEIFVYCPRTEDYLDDSDVVGTGMIVHILCDLGTVQDEIVIVIMGDLTGTGTVDVYDLRALLGHIFDGPDLVGLFLYAASELTTSDELSVYDVRALIAMIFPA